MELERRDGRWFMRDVGSSNGTDIDGKRLEPGEWHLIGDSTIAMVVDVEFRFAVVDDIGGGITLAQSGSFVRKLLLAAIESPDDEAASLEITQGPGAGMKVPLPDELEELRLGPGGHALTSLTTAVTVGREDERFTIESGADAVDGQPVTGRHILRSGESFTVGASQVRFWDPLEEFLEELDAAPEEAPPEPEEPAELAPAPNREEVLESTPSQTQATPSDDGQEQAKRKLGAIEIALILFSLGAIATAIGLLYFVFG